MALVPISVLGVSYAFGGRMPAFLVWGLLLIQLPWAGFILRFCCRTLCMSHRLLRLSRELVHHEQRLQAMRELREQHEEESKTQNSADQSQSDPPADS